MTGFFSIPAWDSLHGLVTHGSVLGWDVVIVEQAWDS